MPPSALRLPAVRGETAVRRFRESDVDAFHAYRSSPELARFQGWSAVSREEAAEFVRTMLGVTQLLPGAWVQLAVAHGASDALLGDVGIFLSEDLSWGEVGFTLSFEAQGRGHATRAVVAASELLLDAHEGIEVRGVTDTRNAASVRVLERAGFERVAVQQSLFKGEPCTELVFRLRRAAPLSIVPAVPDDAGAIHAIQMRAFAEEGRLSGTAQIPPLAETVESIEQHIRSHTVLTARDGDRIVGSARGIVDGPACTVRGVSVEPSHHGRGIGAALLRAIEHAHPGVERFELTTNTLVPGNVAFYERRGYEVVERTAYSDTIVLAQMSKPNGRHGTKGS